MNETTQLVHDTLERILRDTVDSGLRELAETHDGAAAVFPAALWQTLSTSGLTMASVPEALGGPGLPLADAFALVRLIGAHAAPVPLAEHLLTARVLAEQSVALPDGVLSLVCLWCAIRRREVLPRCMARDAAEFVKEFLPQRGVHVAQRLRLRGRLRLQRSEVIYDRLHVFLLQKLRHRRALVRRRRVREKFPQPRRTHALRHAVQIRPAARGQPRLAAVAVRAAEFIEEQPPTICRRLRCVEAIEANHERLRNRTQRQRCQQQSGENEWALQHEVAGILQKNAFVSADHFSAGLEIPESAQGHRRAAQSGCQKSGFNAEARSRDGSSAEGKNRESLRGPPCFPLRLRVEIRHCQN